MTLVQNRPMPHIPINSTLTTTLGTRIKLIGNGTYLSIANVIRVRMTKTRKNATYGA